MNHPEIERSLGDYLDGTLAPQAAERVEAHLADCAECRAELDELRSLIAQASGLPRSIEPPRDLWPDVDAQLDRSAWATIRSLRYPLAAAAAALIIVASYLTTFLFRDAPPLSTDDERSGATVALVTRWEAIEEDYVAAAAELQETLEATKSRLAPETVELIEENLRIIDDAIRETRRALVNDPGSRELMEMLSATHQKKIEVLQQVSRL